MAFGDGDFVEGKYTTEEERRELVNNCTNACNYQYLELEPDAIPQVIIMANYLLLTAD